MTMTVMELKALPLGFRFHPTDEELIRHYLKGKITGQINSEVEVIPEIDVCKCEPWDLPGTKLGVDEEIFVVDLKKGEVTKGPYQGKPDATFSFTDNDFLGVGTGKTNPQIAFIRGAIKIKGSIAAPQKFTPDIFPKPAKL